MSVQEIEIAITQLNGEELNQLDSWLAEYKSEQWDKQIEADAKAGKLDFLIARAKEQNRQGLTRPL